MIVAIVVPVVVVLILVGVIVAVVCWRKKQVQKEQQGSEIISVKKTRPQTPPVDTAKPLEKEKVHNITDEEIQPENVQAGNQDDLQKKNTASEKPDVNI